MFKPVRIVATIVFLASVGLVFVGAFVLGNEVCAHVLGLHYLAYLTSSRSCVSVGFWKYYLLPVANYF